MEDIKTRQHEAEQFRRVILAMYDDEYMFDPYVVEHSKCDFHNLGLWDENTKTLGQACDNLMERLLSATNRGVGTILDVACGKGATTAHVLKYYSPSQVFAINLSEKQIAVARGNAPGATFQVMDATKLEFPDHTFDTVMCVEASFHFNTREAFLREAFRVLKPDGRLVLTDILMSLEADTRRPARLAVNHLSGISAYRDLCHQIGFTDIEIEDITETTWVTWYRWNILYYHEKLLREEMTFDEMQAGLKMAYAIVNDKMQYLVVTASRPA